MTQSVQLTTLEDTRRLAEVIAQHVQTPFAIAINGTLGAGKTQFVRYLAEAVGVPATLVTSPTYVLQQQYAGRFRIEHFDFYRLENEAQVWDLGFDETLETNCLTAVEWASKFPQCLPEDHLEMNFSASEDGSRCVALRSLGPKSAELLSKMAARLGL